MGPGGDDNDGRGVTKAAVAPDADRGAGGGQEAAKPGPLVWDGRDERGRRLPGGVYFLRFEHGTGCETRKAVLIR